MATGECESSGTQRWALSRSSVALGARIVDRSRSQADEHERAAADRVTLEQERRTRLEHRERAVEERERALAKREWMASERDRIADEREQAANRREQIADRRERLADEREGTAEERERERLERVDEGAERAATLPRSPGLLPDVEHPRVRARERVFGAVRSDTDHQLPAVGDAHGHISLQQEREAAEHRFLVTPAPSPSWSRMRRARSSSQPISAGKVHAPEPPFTLRYSPVRSRGSQADRRAGRPQSAPYR